MTDFSINFDTDLVVHKLKRDKFDLSKFDCDKKEYSDYIKGDAFQDQEDCIGQTYLFVYRDTEVMGYVTIAMSQLKKIQHEKLKGFPYGDVPALLLGQLATDKNYQHKGLGQKMVAWVFHKGLELSKDLGCRLIVLNPEEYLVPWYRDKLGFAHIPTKKNKDIMFFDLKRTKQSPQSKT